MGFQEFYAQNKDKVSPKKTKPLEDVKEARSDAHSDRFLVTVDSPAADAIAKFLGLRSKPDIAQRLGKGYANYNSGDRIQFGSQPEDILPEGKNTLEEALDEKELASEMTKILGIMRIASQRVARRGGSAREARAEIEEAYQSGWADAEKEFNKIAAKEVKGVKKFRG